MTTSQRAAALFTRYAAYVEADNPSDRRILRATLDALCAKAARTYVGSDAYTSGIFVIIRSLCDEAGPIPRDTGPFKRYRDTVVPRIAAALEQIRT